MVVKIDELVNELSGLLECSDFLPVDAFCLEDGEEIFSQGVIMQFPRLDIEALCRILESG